MLPNCKSATKLLKCYQIESAQGGGTADSALSGALLSSSFLSFITFEADSAFVMTIQLYIKNTTLNLPCSNSSPRADMWQHTFSLFSAARHRSLWGHTCAEDDTRLCPQIHSRPASPVSNDPKAKMLSLQFFLRKGVSLGCVVGK